MKTIIKTLALALALTSTVAFADPTEGKKTAKFEASTYVSLDNKVRVSVNKNAPERVQISLVDNQGQIVYSNVIAKKEMKYAAKYDLNDLKDGKYTLEIACGDERITKQLDVSSKKIETERQVKLQ